MTSKALDHTRSDMASLYATSTASRARTTPEVAQELWLALELPGLPLAALGQAAADAPPRAVSIRHGRRPCVLTADARARAAGVQDGMNITAATAVCPSLHVFSHDPDAEAAALQGLAAWASRYSSRVSLQPPRGLLLEVGASLRLFGGLGPLLARLRADLAELGHVAGQGIAPTPTAAWLLARAGEGGPVTLAGRLAGALSPVPVHCLELPARTMADLEALGVHTLGQCMRLPRDGLGRRFGPQLVMLLDRALGRRADPRRCWSAPPRFQRRVDLAFESADRSVLLAGARHLVFQLAGFLTARAHGACAVELQLAHRGVPATRLVLELIAPSRDPHHLLAMLAERLERVPIEREVLHLGMRVERLQVLAPRTADLYARNGDAAGPPDAEQARRRGELLVERLGARLGRDAVRVLMRVADHRPERASADAPWSSRAAIRHGCPPGQPPSLSMPLWLLSRPLPMDEAGSPVRLDGRLSIERGPQRIEGGWWDGEDVARDYYVALSSRGTRYWIFRECRTPRRWFVHGIFA